MNANPAPNPPGITFDKIKKGMKIRMKNNSVRLRLTQSEVATFAATGQVKEKIEFGLEPFQQLIYALESDAELKEIKALIENNRITIFVPRAEANEWTNTAQIGLEYEQKIGGGKLLRVLIEKDFACLEPRLGENETDAFPHPLEGKAC